MSVINRLSNPYFNAALSLSAREGVSAGPVAVSAGNGISKNNLSPFAGGSAAPIASNQITNQGADRADAEQLQQADALVADAYSRVRGGGLFPGGLGNWLYACDEMWEAGITRYSVAKDLDARHPPEFIRGGLAGNVGGFSMGGDAMPGGISMGFGTEISRANREEEQGFNLINSSNPTDQSNGSTDMSTGIASFQQLEAYLLRG